MITFYIVIFIVGVLYTFVSLVLNSIGGVFDLGGHIGHMGHIDSGSHLGHIDSGSHAGHINSHIGHNHSGVDSANTHLDHHIGHSSSDGSGSNGNSGVTNSLMSWLGLLINPMVVVSFLTVFGGLGIMGTNYSKLLAPIVFIGALASGILVSYSLYKFIVLPIYRSENTSDVAKENLIYEVAEVISPIMEDGFGEIRYTINSLRYTAPARHHKGKAIAQGEKVVIYRIEDNIFYVVEFPELDSIDETSLFNK
jgi:hypothetical protein